jgi:hypothetical protein
MKQTKKKARNTETKGKRKRQIKTARKGETERNKK